jgi:LmbE family N-acetylglucosaminyl deacetylase
MDASSTFDPALAGTPDRTWDGVLRLAPKWVPKAQPLLVVSPHPDDEVLAAGGLMHSHVRAGFAVTVLSITDGAAAFPDWADLHRIRRQELKRALQILSGGRIKLVALALADGQIGRLRTVLLEAIRAQVGAIDSDVGRRPVVVAPYEADGHPDHDAAGAVSAEVAREEQLTLIRYPVWTWHHATPAALADARWGRLPLDPATHRAKAAAIDCFASQLRPSGRAPIVPPHVVSYFTRPYEAFLL